MKEVSKVIFQRLKRLKKPFSNEWLSEFSSLMEFITANSHTQLIIASIAKEKRNAYASLIRNLKALFIDGKVCLENILEQIKNSNTRATFTPQIEALFQTRVDSKKITDPLFKFEATYFNYVEGYSRLLENILQSDASSLVKNYATIGPNLDVNLSFSPFLRLCNHDVKTLSGLETKAIWSKWDLLLRWEKWTKNGIPPGNRAFHENLSRMFESLKISEAMQCCGLFFLERLTNMQTVAVDSEICLKGLELFLDQDNQYWIIVHFAGENGEKREFFIRKLQKEAQSYELLKLLLEAEPYSQVAFSKLAHTLGELEIKNELKKAFFPHSKFAGSHVQLGQIDVPVDAAAIVQHLSSLQKDRKRHPSFDWGYYHRSSYAYI